MTFFINVFENGRVRMGQSCEVISILQVCIFPFKVKTEVLSSEISKRGFCLELKTVQFREGGSESKVDFDRASSFSIKLLIKLCEERSFLLSFNINNRNKINMIDVLASGLDSFHTFHVIFHDIIKLLLIPSPT